MENGWYDIWESLVDRLLESENINIGDRVLVDTGIKYVVGNVKKIIPCNEYNKNGFYFDELGRKIENKNMIYCQKCRMIKDRIRYVVHDEKGEIFSVTNGICRKLVEKI